MLSLDFIRIICPYLRLWDDISWCNMYNFGKFINLKFYKISVVSYLLTKYYIIVEMNLC